MDETTASSKGSAAEGRLGAAWPPLNQRYSIGRSAACDIVLDDTSVSKISCFVEFTSAETATLWGGRSINPPLLLDRCSQRWIPIPESTTLARRDTVMIGETILTLEQIARRLVGGHDVFISYSRLDEPIARQVGEGLAGRGWKVWRDDRLAVGRAFDEELEAALAASRVTVVLWTENSVKSQWVRAEASLALDRGTLVPVILAGVEPPVLFRTIQGVQLLGREPHDVERLCADLSSKMEEMTGGPTASR